MGPHHIAVQDWDILRSSQQRGLVMVNHATKKLDMVPYTVFVVGVSKAMPLQSTDRASPGL